MEPEEAREVFEQEWILASQDVQLGGQMALQPSTVCN
jgi:hypothetical protein